MAGPTLPPDRSPASRNWKLWALGFAVVLLIIFVIQNSQKVTVDFLFTTADTPLIFALLIAGILGGLIGWLGPIVRRGRKHDRNRDES